MACLCLHPNVMVLGPLLLNFGVQSENVLVILLWISRNTLRLKNGFIFSLVMITCSVLHRQSVGAAMLGGRINLEELCSV